MGQTSRLGTSPEEGIKAPVVAASTGDLTLSGEQTVNTIDVVDGDRVLVRAQTDPVENGIYDASTGAWVRATDFNEAQDVVNGVLVLSAGSSILYQAAFTGEWNPGVTSIAFGEILEFTGPGAGFIPVAGTDVGVPITGILEFDAGDAVPGGSWNISQGDFLGNNSMIIAGTGNKSDFYVSVRGALGGINTLHLDINGKLSTTAVTVSGDISSVYTTKGYVESLIPAGVADNIQRFDGDDWVVTNALTIDDGGIVTVGGELRSDTMAATGAIASGALTVVDNYVKIGAFGILADSGVPVGGSGVAWGGITGTLGDQTDLQAVLDLKANTALDLTAGDGINGGGDLSANRSFAVDTTVVRTTGVQSIAGEKTFSEIARFQATEMTTVAATGAIASGVLTVEDNYVSIGAFGILQDSGVAVGGGGGVAWGSITGTLSAQTDLQGELDAKVGTTGIESIAGKKTFTDVVTEVQALAVINNIASAAISGGNGNYAGIGALGIITDSGTAIDAAAWGSITGTLSAQTDLDTALDARALTTRNMIAGTGLTGGGTLAANRTFNVIGGDGITANANNIVVDSTVVRTSGSQSIGGVKTFSSATNFASVASTGNIASSTLSPNGPVYAGTFGILTVTDPSDRRLKKNIESLFGSLDRMMHLDPVQFHMIDDDSEWRHGFIAQDAGPVFPELATKDEEGEWVTFNKLELVAHLVDAVQELNRRLTDLEG